MLRQCWLQHQACEFVLQGLGVPGAAQASSATSASGVPHDICVVDTPSEAKRVVDLLLTKYKGLCFACGTEVRRAIPEGGVRFMLLLFAYPVCQ